MAAPHVAGVASLLYSSEADNQSIRSESNSQEIGTRSWRKRDMTRRTDTVDSMLIGLSDY